MLISSASPAILLLISAAAAKNDKVKTTKVKLINGNYVKLKNDTFNGLVSLATMHLPANISDADLLKLATGKGGPGSVNMVGVEMFCRGHYTACLVNPNCKESFDCANNCFSTFNTTKQKDLQVQRNLLGCYSTCDVDNFSFLFNRLKECSQFTGSIQKFTPIEIPVPSFISATPLEFLAGDWNIVAGIHPAYDQANGATTHFERQNSWKFENQVKVPTKKKGVSKVITGDMKEIQPGIYFYLSSTAQGPTFNLGTSSSGLVILYYVRSNALSNWHGGVIIKQSAKGDKDLKLSADDQAEVEKLLESAFSSVDPSAISTAPVKNVTDGMVCANPIQDKCDKKGSVCCISNDQNQISGQIYTCRPTKGCASFPKAKVKKGSKKLKEKKKKKGETEATFNHDLSDESNSEIITLDDFIMLNV